MHSARSRCIVAFGVTPAGQKMTASTRSAKRVIPSSLGASRNQSMKCAMPASIYSCDPLPHFVRRADDRDAAQVRGRVGFAGEESPQRLVGRAAPTGRDRRSSGGASRRLSRSGAIMICISRLFSRSSAERPASAQAAERAADVVPHLLHGDGGGVPALPVARAGAEHRRIDAAEPDRRVRLLHRAGVADRAIEMKVLSRERDGLARSPEGERQFQTLRPSAPRAPRCRRPTAARTPDIRRADCRNRGSRRSAHC